MVTKPNMPVACGDGFSLKEPYRFSVFYKEENGGYSWGIMKNNEEQ